MTLQPVLAQIPPDVASLADYEALARERIAPPAWAYIQGGCADEISLRENRSALDALRILPRVLNDVSGLSTASTLFGEELAYPVLIAPMAFQQLAHPHGEIATVRAAAAMQAGMVVSTQAGFSLQELTATAQRARAEAGHRHAAPWWFQLYVQPDRTFTQALVQQAEALGFGALVVTVDAPVNGLRNREQRAGFHLPAGIEAVNLRGMRQSVQHTAQAGGSPLGGSAMLACAPTWQDIAWLRSITRLPVILKGILHPADAQRALAEGVGGLIVSNHGARVLDTVPATIDALPAIAAAVQGRVPVLLDGGIRRGTDILKALALGASAVLVGRPILHALATAGTLGVVHALHLLRTELEIAMVLCGRPCLADIRADLLHR